MKRAPWEYLLARGGFDEINFPDLYWPIGVASMVLFIGSVLLYNVQTRRLHRHFPLVNLHEWLLWTGMATFALLWVEWVFHFYFLFVVLTIVIGVATFLWIRFVRFPPMIDAYNDQLRRARSTSLLRRADPAATVRPKRSERAKRRRRR